MTKTTKPKKKKNEFVSVEVNLDGFSSRPLDPGVTYLDGVCITGHYLPCIEHTPKKDGGVDDSECEKLSLITSDGEYFPATKQELEKHGVFLNKETFHFPPRWSLEGIKRFLAAKHKNKKTGVSFLETFTRIKAKLKTLVDLPEEKWYDVVACYIIGTYFFKLFSAFAILFIHGVQDAGKSKLGECIELLMFNGINSSLFSPAALFRGRDALNAGIVMDEAENLAKDKDRQNDTAPIMLGGYKAGSRVTKAVETAKGFRVHEFSIYGPTVVCNVYGIGLATLLSRCIVLVMLRSTNKKLLNSEVNRNDEEWSWLRDFLHTLQLEDFERVKKTKEQLVFAEDSRIVGRERELWLPLLTIAKIISEEDSAYSFKEFQDFVEDQIKEKKGFEAERPELVLLKKLEAIVLDKYRMQVNLREDESDYWVSVKTLVPLLRQEDDEDQAKFITNRSVSRALKRLGFGKRRTGIESTQFEILPSKFVDCCKRLNVEIDFSAFPKPKNPETSTLSTPDRGKPPEVSTLKPSVSTLKSTLDVHQEKPINKCTSVDSENHLHCDFTRDKCTSVDGVALLEGTPPKNSFLKPEYVEKIIELRLKTGLPNAVSWTQIEDCIKLAGGSDPEVVRETLERFEKNGSAVRVRSGEWIWKGGDSA